MSTPNHLPLAPPECLDLNSTCASIGSKPALEAKVTAIDSKASANFCAASCSLPLSFSAHLNTCWAASVSDAPPPATIEGFSRTSLVTIIESFIDRSTSSTTRCCPPLTKIVTALGSLHPSINTHLSSSTLRSSTSLAWPRSFLERSSRLLIILPPVALASLVISLSFARRTARIPYLAR